MWREGDKLNVDDALLAVQAQFRVAVDGWQNQYISEKSSQKHVDNRVTMIIRPQTGDDDNYNLYPNDLHESSRMIKIKMMQHYVEKQNPDQDDAALFAYLEKRSTGQYHNQHITCPGCSKTKLEYVMIAYYLHHHYWG